MPQYPCHRSSCNKLTDIKATRCDDCEDPSGMKQAARDAIAAAEKRRGPETDLTNAGFQTYTRNGVKGKFWSAGRRRSMDGGGSSDVDSMKAQKGGSVEVRRAGGDGSGGGGGLKGEASRRPPGAGTKT